MDDGLLDIIVIGNVTKKDLAASLHRLYKGTHLTHPKIDSFRGQEVLVEGPGHIPFEMDGEQPGNAPCRVRVVPHALRVLV
jgi:diacylglycerol kinase family enzyme